MLRPITFLAPLLLAGCAAARTNALVVGDQPDARLTSSSVPEMSAPAPTPEPAVALEPAAATPSAEPMMPAFEDEGLHGSRFTLKGGYWGADEEDIDDGYLFAASWMHYFTRLLAIEIEAGYIGAEADDSVVDADIFSVPLFLNGRLNAPLWILDIYGGAGIGTFYYDVDGSGVSEDGWLLGGQAFLGASLNLADFVALGLEGKYYLTEDADDIDAGLDAFALLLTLGFGR